MYASRRGTALIAGVCLGLCGVRTVVGGIPAAQRAEAGRKVAAVLNGNGVFAFDLYQAVRTAEGNLCFSPYNIAVAFGMAWAGARGENAEEMARVLRFPGTEDHVYAVTNELGRSLSRLGRVCGFELDAANAVWVQEGFPVQASYLNVLSQAYAGSCGTLDMQKAPAESARIINRWVSERTRGMVSDLIGPGALRPEAGASRSLMLTSALYFRSAWQYPFDRKATRNDRFTCLDGRTVPCRMMHREARYLYLGLPDLQIIEVPYRGNVLSLLILLPRRNADFARLEASLTFERVAGFIHGLREKKFLLLELPKFTISADIDLKPVLQALGMKRAFSPERANFSGITRAGPLWIDKALHRAVITVDEKGTEAAAGTALEAGPGARAVPPGFRADHPFIYLIRERRTGTALLLGRVMDPSR